MSRKSCSRCDLSYRSVLERQWFDPKRCTDAQVECVSHIPLKQVDHFVDRCQEQAAAWDQLWYRQRWHRRRSSQRLLRCGSASDCHSRHQRFWWTSYACGQVAVDWQWPHRAAYGHANIDIDNQSPYKLIMNEVDTTHDRIGEIIWSTAPCRPKRSTRAIRRV